LVTNELRAALDQKTSEVDSAARKNLNRDRPLNGGTIQDIPPAPPTPQDKSAKEEIKGLKYVYIPTIRASLLIPVGGGTQTYYPRITKRNRCSY
jgi:hypothetical protein